MSIYLCSLFILPPFQHYKPLMWERLKFTERFEWVDREKVTSKTPQHDNCLQVRHVIVDESIGGHAGSDREFYEEVSATTIGVERIKEWSEEYGDLLSDDMVISTNVDEILTR